MSDKKGPWEIQNTLLENEEIPSQEKIVEEISKIDNIKYRAFNASLYLTCGRIGEITRNKFHPNRLGLIKSRLQLNEFEGQPFLTIKLRNQKATKKSKRWKIIPINLDHPIDGKLAKYIIEYAELYTNDKEPLFKFGINRGYQIVSKYMNMNPHYLRHVRLTHLCHQRGYSDHELMKVAGWSDARPSSTYVETRWQDVARKELLT